MSRVTIPHSNSSYSNYDERGNSPMPAVGKEEIESKFRFGLAGLLK